jgi:hypothetical protein
MKAQRGGNGVIMELKIIELLPGIDLQEKVSIEDLKVVSKKEEEIETGSAGGR